MKKILGIVVAILFAIIIFNQDVYAYKYKNDNGIEMTKSQIEGLKKLGFTDLEIQLMTLDEFEKNKDLEGEVVSTTIKPFIIKIQ